MQEKEMMTQPRTDTSALIFKCKAVAAAVGSCELEELLDEVVDTLTQQEATIKTLRSELVELSAKAMSQEDTIRHLRVEICNASAILMTHLETIKTIQAEVDLLNKRPKR
jgi:ABC-type transporter Mla subunit MlaD